MDPDICFEPSIDFSTLKHLVTDVPDPPMAFMKPSWSAKQNNRCFSFRTLKHQIVDVPDPPLISGSACKIQECLQNIESGWSSILNYFFNTLNVAQYRNKICGCSIFLYIYGGFCAFVDQCVQAGLRTENKYNKLTSQKTTTPWDKRSIVLLCFCICLPSSSCDDHVLSYYHSGWYWPEEGQFRFETVGYVDDREIDMYSSESQVNVAKTLWMEENESNNYWERQTSLRKGWEKVFKDNLKILASRFNYTRRLHTLQLGYGCELHNNHNITGHYQYGFDGKDFLVFDINSLLWYPGMQKAEISAQRWNTDRSIGEGVKLYLHEHCISALKKYIDYGRHELENRVVPKVKIRSSKSQNGTTRLQCLVYGFHPRSVHVKWVRNGVDDVPADEMSPILPHPDGTYQIRVSVEVPTKEGDTYACLVNHSSLEETLSVIWVVESDDKTLVLVTVVVAVIVLLIALVSVAFVLKKKSANLYKKVAINLMPF